MSSQSNITRPNVVVVGSCMRGLMEILGSIWYLEEKKFLTEVTTWVGVGNSAYIAGMMALGCTITEIMEDIVSLSMIDNIKPFKENLYHDLNKVRQRLEQRISTKYPVPPTLKSLLESKSRLITLAYNKSTFNLEYIYDATNPSMSVVDAIILSMSTPGVFEETKYGESLYVDGSLLKPYPVDAFVNKPGVKVLGIYVDDYNKNTCVSDDPDEELYEEIRFHFELQRHSLRVASIAQSQDKNCQHLAIQPCPWSIYIDGASERADMLRLGWDAAMAMFPTPTVTKETIKNPEAQE